MQKWKRMRRKPLRTKLRVVSLVLGLTMSCVAPLQLGAQDRLPSIRGPDVAPTASPDPDYSFTLLGRYWRPWLFGNIYITKGGKPGTASRINVREELGIEEDDVPEAGLRVDAGDNRFSFRYTPIEFEGRETVSNPFIYHAATFPTGQEVKSSLSFDFFQAFYDYRLIHAESGELRFGVGAYYWIFDSRLTSHGPGGRLTEHRGFSSILPEAHLSGELTFDIVHVGGSVAGGYLSNGLSILDTEGYVGVRLWKELDLDIGYRYLHFDLKATTNKDDVSLHGPFFQLALKFY